VSWTEKDTELDFNCSRKRCKNLKKMQKSKKRCKNLKKMQKSENDAKI
jgi:hypothetical protein